MRSFIAVDPSREVRDRLGPFMAKLSKWTKGFSWVDPDNIHLTLRFLGEVTEPDAALVGDRLQAVCSRESPIKVSVHGVVFFPSARKPKVVWAGLEGDTERLSRLQGRIEAVLEGLPIHPREDREFKPHLTLARIRDFRSASGVASVLQASAEAEFGEFLVKSVFLYKSDLTPKGSRYTKLSEFHLTGEPHGTQS